MKEILWPFIILSLLSYFLYHIFQGDRGIFALNKLRTDFEKAERNLENLKQKKAILSHKVYLLRPDSLDLDFLEERARLILGFGCPGEEFFYEKDP